MANDGDSSRFRIKPTCKLFSKVRDLVVRCQETDQSSKGLTTPIAPTHQRRYLARSPSTSKVGTCPQGPARTRCRSQYSSAKHSLTTSRTPDTSKARVCLHQLKLLFLVFQALSLSTDGPCRQPTERRGSDGLCWGCRKSRASTSAAADRR
ncbi:hypothetical protein CSUB01_12371 [Colletotrichum sublineola]|uniref:Uncharacterized protein n=1 Tax=Colletotrichum sublineola TaxID=1173701 RepID=A0A066XGL5_COLSU|nr:hypothetical protein CSUB01_12371 [Colletotrichum sublineola]